MPDPDAASRTLDALKEYAAQVINTLRADMQAGVNFGDRAYFVRDMVEQYDPARVRENPPNNEDTAFVVDKGDDFAVCLRDRGTHAILDMSILRFVMLHEMSHIGSRQTGHPDEFWSNFAWLLRYLHRRGMYQPIDYSRAPVNYCGLIVNNNPFYSSL